MGVTYSLFFPPPPTLTEATLPSQQGKVFIVTGGYAGVGYELCSILYAAGAKVYVAGRSEEKGLAAIAKIKDSSTSPTNGELVFLHLALDDLSTIKPAVEIFTSAESRLDVLFNNAGVSNPPQGSVSAQGHELQMATNCLGPHLLTQLLLPSLQRTAQRLPPGSVRVVWTASIAVDLGAPKGGLDLSELGNLVTADPQRNYTTSKLGNWFLADGLAKQAGAHGVLSLVQNPGNLKTELTRHFSAVVPLLAAPLLYPARMGAYTELWAGLSPDLTVADNGKYVLPWGRLHPHPREDLVRAMRSEHDGGTGVGEKFVQYCDEQIAQFK